MATYRQQTGSSLLGSNNCPNCYTTLSLCYSSTFTTASNLYATNALSGGSLAAAGFYSADGPCSQV